ncbi:hypothetical protein [Propioniciclava tarda]|uniref:Uncharacterized protein n=1 Tax=Propioniciclava tarda TaxID=433330 RepID=A0A4V2JTC3_PROTD|nr:hypothetical protein [Propioniciclava tarda]TBT95771.1 hypothetical protein ET996_01970 [Propioniciclava tarda]SMO39285.1 Cobalamin-independent synthase, Catalytic domain [Propioniciclava tarda]
MAGTTGVGSLPGTDAAAAVRLALADVDPAWLPELPARGPWASMVGRATALLTGLSTDLSAGEWRLSSASGIDQRRARGTLRDDLEVLEENAQGYSGPVKLSVCGPWTLASQLFRPLGGRVLGDRGARRDVAQSLADGMGVLVADLRRRLPGLEVRVQVDEPSLPAVLGGRVPTEGGFFRHRSVTEAEVAEVLEPFAQLSDESLVHCCAPDVPVRLLTASGRHGAGFAGISLDGSLLDRTQWDAVAQAVEDGTGLYLGVLDPSDAAGGPDPIVQRALGWLRPLELGAVLADRLWLTHTCGLAGVEPREVPRQLSALRRAAEHVDEALRG